MNRRYYRFVGDRIYGVHDYSLSKSVGEASYHLIRLFTEQKVLH